MRQQDVLISLLAQEDINALIEHMFPPAPTNKKEIRQLVCILDEMRETVEALEPATTA